MLVRNTRQRREQALQMLVDFGSVQVLDLAEKFGVSGVTIRSDLDYLVSQGVAMGTHGGASLARTPLHEDNIQQKSRLNTAPKEAIGACAARLVRSGDNIII